MQKRESIGRTRTFFIYNRIFDVTYLETHTYNVYLPYSKGMFNISCTYTYVERIIIY